MLEFNAVVPHACVISMVAHRTESSLDPEKFNSGFH